MNFRVIIDGGQSNNNGEVLLSTLTAPQLAEITVMRRNVFSFNSGVIQYFQTGYNNRRRARFEQKMGWRDELARLIDNGSHDPVVFIQHAEGGTGVADRWRPSLTEWDDSELLMLINKMDAFEVYFDRHIKNKSMWDNVAGGYDAGPHTFSYECFNWNQGEQDSGIEADANNYQTNCQNTWDVVKTRAGNSDLPIFDWKMSDQIVGASGFRGIVNTAKIALQAANNNVTLYDTDGSDGYSMINQTPLFIHYDYTTCVNTVAPLLYSDYVSLGII